MKNVMHSPMADPYGAGRLMLFQKSGVFVDGKWQTIYGIHTAYHIWHTYGSYGSGTNQHGIEIGIYHLEVSDSAGTR